MATGGAVQWPTCTDASTALMQSKRSGNRHGDGTDHLIAQLISGGGRASEEVEIGAPDPNRDAKFRQPTAAGILPCVAEVGTLLAVW